MSDVGTVLLVDGRYRLDTQIASGSSGETWRGTDLILARPVAVKLLRADFAEDAAILARFRAAARHAGVLAHENIARIYDYDESGVAHRPFLVMELVDGPSLADLLAAGPLEPTEVLDLIAQSAAGLAAAHRAGLVHRDIRPGNLLLASGDVVKITNFGISHARGDVPVTVAGLGARASDYLAPERAAGASGTPASDLYSLGVVAYECLAGSAPYRGTGLEVALAHQRDPLPPLPDAVPAAVAALIWELTAKDPDARPSAAQVADQAGELRDTLFPGGLRGEQVTGQLELTGQLPAAPGPDLPGQTRPGLAADGPASGPAASRAGRRGGPPRLGRVVAAAAVVAAVAALAWVLTGVIGHGAAQAPAQSVSGPAGARLVEVNAAALRGRPVTAVSRQLRHQRLIVRVRWRASDQVSPGEVLSVAPAGRVPVHSVVVVTGAIRPAGTSRSPGKPGHRQSPGQHPGRHKDQSPGPGQSQPATSSTPTTSPSAQVSPTPAPSPSASASPSPTVSATAPVTAPVSPPPAP
jgi:tRNA A-37 threonylcarbamoyl transferase component Bud32